MLVLCLLNYDKNQKKVVNRLSAISEIPENVKLSELNSIAYSDSIMWDYIRIADNVLHTTNNKDLFCYVLTDTDYRIKFKLVENSWIKVK